MKSKNQDVHTDQIGEVFGYMELPGMILQTGQKNVVIFGEKANLTC